MARSREIAGKSRFDLLKRFQPGVDRNHPRRNSPLQRIHARDRAANRFDVCRACSHFAKRGGQAGALFVGRFRKAQPAGPIR